MYVESILRQLVCVTLARSIKSDVGVHNRNLLLAQLAHVLMSSLCFISPCCIKQTNRSLIGRRGPIGFMCRCTYWLRTVLNSMLVCWLYVCMCVYHVIYIYIYILQTYSYSYMYVYMCVYIYIYIERERDRERERMYICKICM